jgi:hypothetical protein
MTYVWYSRGLLNLGKMLESVLVFKLIVIGFSKPRVPPTSVLLFTHEITS